MTVTFDEEDANAVTMMADGTGVGLGVGDGVG